MNDKKYFDILESKGCTRPSYWHQPSTEPLLSLTIGQLVDYAAEQWGDNEAFVSVHENVRLTFKQVREKADQIAAGLLQLGLKPGDVLAIWGFNSSVSYLTALAARRAGLIMAGLDPCGHAPELLHCLTKTEAKALICVELNDENFYEILRSLAPEMSQCPADDLHIEKLPNLKTVIFASKNIYLGTYTFNDVIKKATTSALKQIQAIQNFIQPDDATGIHFTSGSTGKSKAVLLSHHAIINDSYVCGKLMRLHLQRERILSQLLLCHSACNILVVYPGLHFGSTTVFSGAKFHVESAVKTLQDERCTITFDIPSILVDIITFVKECRIKLDYPRVAITGGAPLTERLAAEIKNTLLSVKHILISYGMTECCSVTMSLFDEPGEKLSTVGRVIDGVEVKVVDGSGKMVPMGTPGQLFVRGYNVMLKYWNDTEKTAETLTPDNWLETGDQCILQDDGYFKIVGRIKDIIIRAGYNIYPVEIENILNNHPAITEVHAFGVPDERMGEEICVCIKMKDIEGIVEQDIRDFCKEKLEDYRTPRYIRFTNEFPKNARGKIDKKKLKETFMNVDEEYLLESKQQAEMIYGATRHG